MKGVRTMSAVKITDLRKSYGDHLAVAGINLNITEGQIYGILGPNGAGKSTTINMICGLLTPSGGEIYVLGERMGRGAIKVKGDIGLVPQDIAIYEDLTALENVRFFASLYGLTGKEQKERAREALEFVGLLDRAKEKPSKYSGGMKRRLNIACAIVHRPKLIIMDEPTVGIDPQSRNHILTSIRKLNEMGCTVIYTSHYMEEVQTICSHIAIMDHGKVIEEGPLADVVKRHSDTSVITIYAMEKIPEETIASVKAIPDVESAKLDDTRLIVYNKSDSNHLDKIILALQKHKIAIKNIESKLNDLETIFLSLTGKKLRD